MSGPAPSAPPSRPPLAFVDDLHRPRLSSADEHHLARVLRVRPGDVMTVADGNGRWRAARFGSEPDPDGPIVEEPPAVPALTIAFALLKGDAPESVVRKLTELGIDRIVPFVSSRSVARPDPGRATRRVERLARVAREAAMQSRRSRLPELSPVVAFEEAASLAGAARTDRAGAPPDLTHPVLLVGPEGGWDAEERARLPGAVGLGPHVLRAETAAVVAGALLAALRAELVHPRPIGGG